MVRKKQNGPDEAEGQYFLNLDIGLPVGELLEAARQALTDGAPDTVELKAHDRLGHPVLATNTFSALKGPAGTIEGVILTMNAERLEEES